MNNNIFIPWEDLELKKELGTEKIQCPECDPQKPPALSINHDKGVGYCHRCEAKTFRDPGGFKKKTKVNYFIPPQDWKKHTVLTPKMAKWIEQDRKIPISVALDLGWTEEDKYFPDLSTNSDPKAGTRNCLVFNYFEEGLLVNKKYRTATEGGDKIFSQIAKTKNIFYNINAAIGAEELYIVEGEFDVGALRVIGIKNVISVPNGANDNDGPWIESKEYLKDIKRFIIAVDMDTKGLELREKIAHRLGKHRCEFVEWKGKDANEDLISGVLEETVIIRKRFPVDGTFRVSDLMSGILHIYDHGLPPTYCPKGLCFGDFKNVFSVMKGQLTTITGIPSHGKSSLVDWYVLNLIKDYGFKASWFSPEHNPMPLYKTKFIQLATGKNFFGVVNGHDVPRISKEEIEQYQIWAEDRVYLTDAAKTEVPTWDWLFSKFQEQVYSFGINIFIIDAFNKVILPSTGNELEHIRTVLTRLNHFAQSNDVFVFLIAHPTKMTRSKDGSGRYTKPGLYDVSGSANFRNMSDNGLCVYRHFGDATEDGGTEVINLKTKYSFQGKMAESGRFYYNENNGRFSTISPLYDSAGENSASFFETEEEKKIRLESVKDTPTDDIDF